MQPKSRWTVAVVLGSAMLLSGCTNDSEPANITSASGPDRIVSLVDLVVTPEKDEDVAIRVSGFLSATGSLYLTREYAEMLDVGAVAIEDQTPDSFIAEHCLDSYAMVEGRFRRNRELPGAPSEVRDYHIEDVTRVLVLRDGVLQRCWPPTGQ